MLFIKEGFMNPYMKGMVFFFCMMIILYFISRKKKGIWTTAFKIVAWIFGLGFAYSLIMESVGSIILYTISLVLLAVVCFLNRHKDEAWNIGFWISLVYVIPPIIGLIIAFQT
jgi:uncharacterized membrane protein YeiB